MGYKAILNLLKPYKKLILVTIGLLALLLAVAFLFDKCSAYLSNREIEKDKEAINAITDNVNLIQNNLRGLEINEALKEHHVNLARNDFENRQKETDEARERANQGLQNINAILNTNFANRTLEDVLKARCEAIPDSPECRK